MDEKRYRFKLTNSRFTGDKKSGLCGQCRKYFKTERGLVDHMKVSHSREEIASPVCTECNTASARIVSGDVVYPNLPHLFAKPYWMCACGAYVGCHPQSHRPLGRPAGQKTRRARNYAHDEFDPLWRDPRHGLDRKGAYKWLAEELGLHKDDCHIGMMDRDTALAVVRLCKQKRKIA